MRNTLTRFVYLAILALPMIACSNGNNSNSISLSETPEPTPVPLAPNEQSVFDAANGCYAIPPTAATATWL